MTWFRASLSHCRDKEPPGPEELICHQGDIAVVISDAVQEVVFLDYYCNTEHGKFLKLKITCNGSATLEDTLQFLIKLYVCLSYDLVIPFT